LREVKRFKSAIEVMMLFFTPNISYRSINIKFAQLTVGVGKAARENSIESILSKI
jgi:hypothetical protein